MSFMFFAPDGMSESEAFKAAVEAMVEEKRQQKEAALKRLDPTKEYTGEVDGYGEPIYNGSIIALFSGFEGYWMVYKGSNGEWLKRSIRNNTNTLELVTVEPLMDSMQHGQVIESIEAFEAENWEMFAYLPGPCQNCQYKKECNDENLFDQCRTGALENDLKGMCDPDET